MIIGLDVGGTHADAVLLDAGGVLNQLKVPTDAADLFQTVLTGIEKITEGVDPARIQRLVLSTTLTTNAIVQGDLPPVGMVVSAGPGLDPELLRSNEDFLPVGGAIDHRGREVAPVDIREVRRAAEGFRQKGIRSVGVVSKFSVRNPCHELAIEAEFKEDFDRVFLGHRISGNLNFPRRIATTYLNAAVHPVHQRFFSAVRQSLQRRGLEVPIRVLKADGGNMNLDASLDFPAQTIFSGPAASVMGTLPFAPLQGASLVLDIGGTTTDMAVLIDAVPVLDPIGIEFAGFKTLVRSLKTHSIAMGGDSVVTVTDGRVAIGPQRKGPAMAFGGSHPTPTDALAVLGRLESGDRSRAVEGIGQIAGRLGVDVETAAGAIFEQACRTILEEAGRLIDRINSQPVYTVHEMLDGVRVSPKTLLVLGGPAPYFAEGLREMSAFSVNVVPRWEVANAIGAALARTTCEVVLFVDTQRGVAVAPYENFCREVGSGFSRDEALSAAFQLLEEKAVRRGANPLHLETEVLENLEFNMVKGFSTVGKTMRIKVQVKPGLIHGYESVCRSTC